MDIVRKYKTVLVTLGLVIVAIIAIYSLYYRSVNRPWTRDGQVSADIIEITSQVSGQVVKVAVKDNQRVKKGELLFQIDPENYKLKVNESEVKLDQSRQEVKSLAAQIKAAEAEIEQRKAQLTYAETERDRIFQALKTNAVSQATADQSVASVGTARANLSASLADLEEANANLGVDGEENVKIRSAKVDLANAKLQLSWTSINAPSDGYVTNLQLRIGDYSVAGSPVIAFVDASSYYVYGFFKETQLLKIKPGNRAVVTLMGYPDLPIEGEVNSIGRAISSSNTSASGDLIPDIAPTFDWVRLAQRIPVRIDLKTIPEGVDLVAGMTASVAVYPNE